jgi:phosphoribosylaminoimidazolecarboxamide formyltransferase/IMP cyclohydrolase
MSISSKHIQAPEKVKIRRALLSVFDKTGLLELAQALTDLGIELVSTGGSSKAIAQAGLAVRDVSDLTGFPEIMDGRVKTLHPGIHGGLLAIRDDQEHSQAMSEHHIPAIDLLVCNLYPFEKVVAEGSDYATTIENIDIGGPAMTRAAAKNHAYVTVLTDPSDYEAFVAELKENGGQTSLSERKKYAQKAYSRTAAYDAAVSNWMADALDISAPPNRALAGSLSQTMRYGENPHQSAAFYTTGELRPGVASAVQHQGKQLSYNNINDTDAAFELISEFSNTGDAAVAIIKHANPCGVATGKSLLDAYKAALACDTVSAFGGIVALNQEIDADVARAMVETFTEVIIAPAASAEAMDVIGAKKNLRLLTTGGLADPKAPGLAAKTVAGGLLVQQRDSGSINDIELKVVTKRAPTEAELADMKMAFRVAKHVKSNAIIYVKNGATVGIGAGQMSRLDSSRIAARKADDMKLDLTGSAVASDAFFPFADGLLAAADAGASAIIQPGGSMRDDEVIAAADEAGLTMVFTGMRHFRH